MNPFDLRGPEFLLFYLGLGLATLAVARLLLRAGEAGSSGGAILDDYLAIAYLRGGNQEALRVATLNLINRGLLDVSASGEVSTRDAKAIPNVARRLERLILQFFKSPTQAARLFSNAQLSATASSECEPPLQRLGLVPDKAANAARRRLFAAAALLLAAVAVTKIVIALGRGRPNIQFLLMEAFVFVVLVYKVTHPLRTRAGDAQLADLKTLFDGLNGRSSSFVPGSQTQDFALLTAVFGLSAIPSSFDVVKRLFPKAQSSSCGTNSCGSSCGSSCGGGGCGGGCGGCGS